MGKYLEWRDYFEQIAEKNIAVSHSKTIETQKKFFEVMLEEVISGITHKLPSKENGAFIIFSGYLDRFNLKDSKKKNREIMFFVMQSTGNNNYKFQSEAKDNCEEVVDDILRKMLKDSTDGHPLYNSAFDRIENVSIIATEFKIGTSTYVGWQVAIGIVVYFNPCFKPESWKP